jgi:cytochrome P450
VNHIVTHTFDFQKEENGRKALSRLVGEGVLVAEAESHRKQRRVMNPGFGPIQIRALTDIFIEKSAQLRDVWLEETRKSEGNRSTNVNALSWLSRATLDIIGLAGEHLATGVVRYWVANG